MKKYIVILPALLSVIMLRGQDAIDTTAVAAPDTTGAHASQAAPAASVEALWDEANVAYINGAYSQAITLYESILARGERGYKLYYNLGNACFKTNEIGRAILYYNKAYRLAPTDGDIRHNLTVAGSYVKDKIERVPEFFVNRWMRQLRMSLSGYTWTWISLALLLGAIAAAITYLLAGKMALRKTGFYVGVACGVLFVTTTIFAAASRGEMLSPVEGVVMSAAVPVKSSPDGSSQDLFVIHEGTTVRVVGALQGWREVVIADGNKGWILASSIEMI